MLADSLRVRLTLWYTIVLALVLLGFAASSYYAIAGAVRHTTDESLRSVAAGLEASISEEVSDPETRASGYTSRAVAEIVRAFRAEGVRFAVVDDADQMIGPADGAQAISDRGAFERMVAGAAAHPEGVFETLPGAGDGTRAYAVRKAPEGLAYTIVVTTSLAAQSSQIGAVRRVYIGAIPIALLCAALGGSLIARRGLAPVVEMADQAARIEAMNLHERLRVVNERDEVGRLAAVINALLARLEASFDHQRRFMADASHELRTPVAIVRGEAEVSLSREDRGAEDYRDSLEIIHDEGKRLTRIVEDLFMLARADAGQQPLVAGELCLDEVLFDSVRAVRSLAAGKQITVTCDPSEELPLWGDEALLVRMFVNLLDNAIKHTAPGGSVRVRAEMRGTTYVVTVEDTGMGIPVEDQPFVFERFYRADKVRARVAAERGSGAGLGLSIARWIAEAHGGSAGLVRSDEHGTTFSVTLPSLGTRASRPHE